MIIDRKYNWLFILQGWAILWVVIGNTYLTTAGNGPDWESTLLRTAYTFHLPLLMFVSGCIFCKTFLLADNYIQQTKDMLREQLLGLFIPFVIFTIIAIIAKTALSNGAYSIETLKSDFIQGFLFPSEQPISPLWFVMALMWLHIMLPLWKYLLEKEWLLWAGLVVLLGVHIISVPIEFLCIKWFWYFAVYFFLGMVIMKKDFLHKLSGLTGFYIFIEGYIIYILGVDVDKTIAEVGGILFSIGVTLILNNTFPRTFFSFRDYYFQIFLMSYFVQLIFRVVYPHLPISYIIGYFICLSLGIYIPVMITKLLQYLKSNQLQIFIGSVNLPKAI